MNDSDIILITGENIRKTLRNQENVVLDTVRKAYELHHFGDSILPNSVFLRLPGNDGNRVIGLPAQIGGEKPVVGMKWIASFPQNVQRGWDRASAVIVLNNPDTGRPQTILEGSVISAVRTAASAALASQLIACVQQVDSYGVVGCGRINFEIVRFLLAVHSNLRTVILYDKEPTCMHTFKRKCKHTWPKLKIVIVKRLEDLTECVQFVSFATTSCASYVLSPTIFHGTSLILHISLRDLAPEIILECDNVVDDIGHICRENTSVHLAEKMMGSRAFIRCTLGDIILGKATSECPNKRTTIFSPFGLGVLDLAVAKLVLDLSIVSGKFCQIESFLPSSWLEDLQGNT